MHSLTTPRLASLFSNPSARPAEPEDGLAKLRRKFSPARLDQQSYPSPPMSEPHSPPRRPAQMVESKRHPYPPPIDTPQRSEVGMPLLPPSSLLYDPRPTLSAQGALHQRPQYSGDPPRAGPSTLYQPIHAAERSPYSSSPPLHGYGYGHPNTSMSSYPGMEHEGPVAQPTAMIAPPPARLAKPARRTKAHVASACVNCKKAHLSCDVQRPCGRCVASGKEDTCKDVQHKKRGRPRLRDDRGFSRPEEGRQPPSQILGAARPSNVITQHNRFSASRTDRTSDPSSHLEASIAGHDAFGNKSLTSASSSGHASARAQSLDSILAPLQLPGPKCTHQLPVAFLNLDLVVQKSNQAFQDLVAFGSPLKGRHLGDMVEVRQHETLQRLRNDLRDERDEREPTYMAPITPVGQDPLQAVMELVREEDLDLMTHGFTDRPLVMSFPSSDHDQQQPLQVQVRLAKTSLYFVTLVVHVPSKLSAPPLMTHQIAPPTPSHKSHPRSAPSTSSALQFASHPTRPWTTTSSAPSSPYSSFSSVRTSFPGISSSPYDNNLSHGYYLSAGPEPALPPATESASQSPSTYPSPYPPVPRNPSVTSAPAHDVDRSSRFEGLQLPPLRTGPSPLASPLHLRFGSQSATEPYNSRVRRRELTSAEEQVPEIPETGKRRRLNIHEVLE